MNIEPPGIDEADALADAWVALAADQRAYDSLLLPEENRASARESICRSIVTGGMLVARLDDDVAGFVQFSLESGLYETDLPKGVVENLFVAAEHRDAGVGSALLDAAEEALVADGAAVVVLDVMADNEDARRFYRRHGYDPHRITMLKRVESDLHTEEDR